MTSSHLAAPSPSSVPLPHVQVLLATFNGERWLDEQLRSVFAQTGVRVSVLVSDHGSTDDTLALLARWQAKGHALAVMPGCPATKGSAANFLRLLCEHQPAGAEYVALADQDDVWLPERLARAIAQMRGCGADGYSSDVMAVWPDGRETPLRKSHAQRRYDYLLEPAGPGCSYVMTAALVDALRTELADRPERFVGVHQHDWLIYAYARTHGHVWFIDHYTGIRYRQHPDNEVGANVGLGGIFRRWEWVRSGRFRRQMLQMAGLWPAGHQHLIARFERLNWIDRLALMPRSRQLRRRPKDQLALFSMLFLDVFR
jgi:rhamnosyltransferase